MEVPTRLIDWTESSQVALYFAVRQTADDGDHAVSDAAVFVLDPYELNQRVLGKPWVIPVGERGVSTDHQRLTGPWLPKRFHRYGVRRAETCAVSSPHLFPRMAVQRSCFTVAGRNSSWLESKAAESFTRRILIPRSRIREIRRELEVCGVDDSTVFPDLDGLGRTLTHKWLTSAEVDGKPHLGVYTRLRPSEHHGVGVFAIRGIPAGTRLFLGDDENLIWIPQRSLGHLPAEVRRLYDDFAVLKDGHYGCPRNFNLMTVAWYLNESRKPNVRCDSNYDFFAARDIRAGEELTADYSTYSEP